MRLIAVGLTKLETKKYSYTPHLQYDLSDILHI